MVTGGNPFFNNCNIKLFSELVPRFNDVTELISSLSLSLRFDSEILEITKKTITIEIIIVSTTTVKYWKILNPIKISVNNLDLSEEKRKTSTLCLYTIGVCVVFNNLSIILRGSYSFL